MGPVVQMILAAKIAAGASVYATWNPADKGPNVTTSGGDLTYSTGSMAQIIRSTISKTSGIWYFENVPVSGSFNAVGIDDGSAGLTSAAGAGGQSIAYRATGEVIKGGSVIASYAAYGPGDVVGVVFNAATGSVSFYKNNTFLGTPGSITGSVYALGGGYVATGAQVTSNFGASAMAYSPPGGANAGLYT